MKYVLLILFIISCCASCVHTSEGYDEYKVYLISDNKYNFDSTSAEIDCKKLTQAKKKCEVTFDRVVGGKTLLFGVFPYSEGNGYSAKRLEISYENTITLKLSVDDLKETKKDTINLDFFLSKK